MSGVAIVGDLKAYVGKPVTVSWVQSQQKSFELKFDKGTLREVSDLGVQIYVPNPPDEADPSPGNFPGRFMYFPFLGVEEAYGMPISNGRAIREITSQNNERLFFNPRAPAYVIAFKAVNVRAREMVEELRETFSQESFGGGGSEKNILKNKFGDSDWIGGVKYFRNPD